VAEFQISEEARPNTGAGVPFPTLAYHLFVEHDGSVYYANDLGLRTWHNAGAGHNNTHIGICYAGNVEPSAAQIFGLARAIAWCQRQLRRDLPVTGHKDAPYDTHCPGDAWPVWKPSVTDVVARLQG
jgi:hypothetical protein